MNLRFEISNLRLGGTAQDAPGRFGWGLDPSRGNKLGAGRVQEGCTPLESNLKGTFGGGK
jgi:hypothetical protein